MSGRPSIPVDVKRNVLHEARHRCAVCGEPLPLEMAHIIPWRKTRDHSAENLIALCPGCHARADGEDWGADYLRRYKKRPHALETRRPRKTTPSQQAAVDLILNSEPEDLPLSERFKILKQVAVYLEIPLKDIDLLDVKKTNSSRVTLGLPEEKAYALYAGFRRRDGRLFEAFADFGLRFIEEPQLIGKRLPVFAYPFVTQQRLRISIDSVSGSGNSQLVVTDSRTGEPVGSADMRFEIVPGRLLGALDLTLSGPFSDAGAYIRFQISVLGDAGQTIHQSRAMRIKIWRLSATHEFVVDWPRYVARRAVALSVDLSIFSSSR